MTALVLDRQVAEVVAQRSGLSVHNLQDGTHMLRYPTTLGSGWSKPAVQVSFVLPLAYPAAQPDCFFTEPDLRLITGAMPANTGIQQLDGAPLLWFSWHLTAWSPQRDDLNTYIRFVESRLHDCR